MGPCGMAYLMHVSNTCPFNYSAGHLWDAMVTDDVVHMCLMQMMMTNGMSGIAFVGGDICGFQYMATEELCARWAAAGAWQPFARNHHAQGFQEFYLWASLLVPRSQNQCMQCWRIHEMSALQQNAYLYPRSACR